MNKVITINLNGNAFQFEEGGYDLLHDYLDGAALRLADNPDRDEIVADIERAIADKCRALLSSFKTVVVTKEVQQVIDEMGPVENASAETDEAAAGNQASSPGQTSSQVPPGAGAADAPGGAPTRRLYKIEEDEMVCGVCTGLAAYFNIDVTFVRIAFVLVFCIWGTGILVYIVLAIVVPTADTAAKRAAAEGKPATAQEFIHRARAGYYEGLKTISDHRTRGEWRRRFLDPIRDWWRKK
jgi:phage shock protein PspC (stress-responsive transcriptional regulator)